MYNTVDSEYIYVHANIVIYPLIQSMANLWHVHVHVHTHTHTHTCKLIQRLTVYVGTLSMLVVQSQYETCFYIIMK